MENKKIVSLILARGGSKGIPDKNIIDVCGKPLIAYTIEASLNSNVNETWVSTDSIRIADIAHKYGANIIKRPDELAKDTSSSEDAILHFLSKVDVDILVFIQPTSPLLRTEYINDGLNMIKNYDSVFSAYKEHWLPRWTTKSIPQNWNIFYRPRRQDVDSVFVENGAFYIAHKHIISSYCRRYGGNIGIYEMPQIDSFQVDTPEDLEIIKAIMLYKERK